MRESAILWIWSLGKKKKHKTTKCLLERNPSCLPGKWKSGGFKHMLDEFMWWHCMWSCYLQQGHPVLAYRFQSSLPRFWVSCLLILLGRHQITQLCESLLPTWMPWMEFWAHGFNQVKNWLFWPFREWPRWKIVGKSLSFCLPPYTWWVYVTLPFK